MHTGRSIAAILLGVCLSFSCLASEEQPPWIKSPPQSDDSHFYVVALGEGDTLSAAKQEAEKSAWLSFAHQIVGVRGEGTEELSANLKTTNYQRKIRFGSDVIEFRGIEIFKTFDEKIQAGFRLYLLARIPRTEAEEIRSQFEKARKQPPNLSRVTFESVPSGAEIAINGTSYGSTPLKVLLPPKAYVVRLSKSGFRMETKKVLIRSREDQTISAALDTLSGTLQVTASPPQADIYIDDRLLGSSGVTDETLSAGSHKLQIKAEGYKSAQRTIAIRSGRKLEIQITLQKVQPPKRKIASIEGKLDSEATFDNRCVKALRKSKWAQLIEVASEWKTSEPRNYVASYYRGLGFLRLHHVDEAVSSLEESDRQHSHWIVMQTLCEAYLAAGKVHQAEQKCRTASSMQLNDAYTYVLLAKIKERQSEYRAGYEYLRVATSLDKNMRGEINRFCEKYRPWKQVEECQRIYPYPKIYNN